MSPPGSGGPPPPFSLGPFLVDLVRKRPTGCLRVEGPGAVREVFLEAGQIVFARSNVAGESLGRILLAEGKITRDQYEESLRRMVAEKVRQGDLLLSMGFVTAEDLNGGLVRQSEAVLLGAFQSGAEGARFQPLPSLPEGTPRLKVPLPPVVWRGIRKGTPLAWIERALAPNRELPLAARLRPEQARELGMDEVEGAVVKALEGRPSIHALIDQGIASPERVLRTIYGLTVLGLLTAAPAPSSAPVPAPARPSPSTPPPAGPLGPEDQEAMSLIEERLKTAQGKDHFGVLGLERGAPKAQVKKIYFQLARTFHPDRFFERSPAVRHRADDYFTLITRAYDTLSNDGERAKYEEFLKTGKTEEDKLQDALKMVEGEGALGRAEAAAGRSEWKRAEEAARKAIELRGEEPEALGALGWALFGLAVQKGLATPEGKDLAKGCRQALDKALSVKAEKPVHTARAHYVRGLLAEAEGNMDDALVAFGKANEANPKMIEAGQKLRVIRMRLEKSQQKGVFGKLFK